MRCKGLWLLTLLLFLFLGALLINFAGFTNKSAAFVEQIRLRMKSQVKSDIAHTLLRSRIKSRDNVTEGAAIGNSSQNAGQNRSKNRQVKNDAKTKQELQQQTNKHHQQHRYQQQQQQQLQQQKKTIGSLPNPDKLRDIVSKANPPNKERVWPHNFQLTLNEPDACVNPDGSSKSVFLLVLVTSIHKQVERRRAIRETWGRVKNIEGKQIITLFMLAKNEDKQLNELVEQESKQYHDLLMEDFVDTYRNLTYKTVMGVKWAAVYCPKANFAMKTDDDMYINYENLVKYLAKPLTPTENHVVGFVINGGPIRNPNNKWYMPVDLYPRKTYPPFCSGTAYVMSGDVALKVYAISAYTSYLPLEDVYFAICMEKLHIVPVKHGDFHNWRVPYSYCGYKRMISSHMIPPEELRRIWKDQHTKKTYSC